MEQDLPGSRRTWLRVTAAPFFSCERVFPSLAAFRALIPAKTCGQRGGTTADPVFPFFVRLTFPEGHRIADVPALGFDLLSASRTWFLLHCGPRVVNIQPDALCQERAFFQNLVPETKGRSGWWFVWLGGTAQPGRPLNNRKASGRRPRHPSCRRSSVSAWPEPRKNRTISKRQTRPSQTSKPVPPLHQHQAAWLAPLTASGSSSHSGKGSLTPLPRFSAVPVNRPATTAAPIGWVTGAFPTR